MARARAIDTRLEKLIPSTDELFVAGILTKEEIQQLVKDRTFHEYKLVARPLLLIDVKNAITFEMALEKKVAAYCAEFNRQAALEASGVDENGKKKNKQGGPAKKLQLKHRWAVQERIESIYRIGLRHLFSQRKAASLLQLKRKSSLTTAALTGVAKRTGEHGGASAAADASNNDNIMDDYEMLRRECVAQLKAFSRNSSLSKLYAEWLTRSPQDAFLWSEAALFEAQSGRNDEARAIIQQALATLRQSSSNTSKAGTTAQATATAAVKLAGREFTNQRASEESKEVFGTALLIEILFAKRLLEGAIETAVRNDDKTPADSLRNENAALAAITLDLALAEAVVVDAAQPTTEGQLPFLCPDLGLHLYAVAVCHQFTAALCRKILLQTFATVTASSSSSSASAKGGNTKGPLAALLTELFLSDIRFAATNCVSAEQFITEKTLADLALLQTRSNGDDLKREWVVRQLHRKHRVVTIKEKKEKVLSSIGAALTLITVLQTAEKSLKNSQKLPTSESATITTNTLFAALLRTILSTSATAASLVSLRFALSDAILELLSLSRELQPIHLDDAQEALAAFDVAIEEEKAARKARKEKELEKKNRKRAREGVDAAAEDEAAEDDAPADPDAFLNKATTSMFLFSQAESSKILRVVLLLECVHEKDIVLGDNKKKALSLVDAVDASFAAATSREAIQDKKKSAAALAASSKKEALSTLEMYRELCTAASVLTPLASANADDNDNAASPKGKKGGVKGSGKKPNNKAPQPSSEADKAIEHANRRLIISIGNNGSALLKSFVEVAFGDGSGASSTNHITHQSTDLLGVSTDDANNESTSDAAAIDNAFTVCVSPQTTAGADATGDAATGTITAAADSPFTREQLWWNVTAATESTAASMSLIDTKFLSARMTPEDLVVFLGIAQPSYASSATAASAAPTSTPSVAPSSSLNITTREEVAVHISRVLALVDNEAALHEKQTTAGAASIKAPSAAIISKLAAAIQLVVCTPQKSTVSSSSSGAAFLPYDPSLWRLFAALQHAIAVKVRSSAATTAAALQTSVTPSSGNNQLTSSSALGAKIARASDSDSDEDAETRNFPKKKLRIGNNGTVAASSSSSAAAESSATTSSLVAATSVLTQRSELNAILEEIISAVRDDNTTDHHNASRLVALARRLFRVSLQVVAGGCSHASLPTSELRVERLRGILALTIVEVIREMEDIVTAETVVVGNSSRVGYNSAALFLGAQVLRFNQLVVKIAASAPSANNNSNKTVASLCIHALLTQLTRVHNLLLPPIRILDAANSTDALGHGYATPVTRALLRSIFIPAFGAAHVAATSAVDGGQKKELVAAAEKVIHSLIAQLTSLYVVEVKEGGKFGNGIRNSSQYAVVQQKEVSDYIVQNRSEAFLPFFFHESSFVAVNAANGAMGPQTSAKMTKTNVINAQVADWLLALNFEQQYTKNLTEARAMHARAVQSVEAPQMFLAAVAGGSLPSLF